MADTEPYLQEKKLNRKAMNHVPFDLVPIVRHLPLSPLFLSFLSLLLSMELAKDQVLSRLSPASWFVLHTASLDVIGAKLRAEAFNEFLLSGRVGIISVFE